MSFVLIATITFIMLSVILIMSFMLIGTITSTMLSVVMLNVVAPSDCNLAKDNSSSLFFFIISDEEKCFITLSTGIHLIKRFSCSRTVLPCQPFQPSLMFASKARPPNFTSEFLASIRLGKKNLPRTNTLAYFASKSIKKTTSIIPLTTLGHCPGFLNPLSAGHSRHRLWSRDQSFKDFYTCTFSAIYSLPVPSAEGALEP